MSLHDNVEIEMKMYLYPSAGFVGTLYLPLWLIEHG